MTNALDRALRPALTALHGALRLGWFVRRPRTFGAHALAITPGGRIVLVKLRYAPGWRLPGGGRREGESPEEAVLRELREEIGLTRYGSIERACELEEQADFKRDLAALLIVRGVEYRPRWSWEVEDVIEADPRDLPAGLSPRAARWLALLLPRL